MEVYLCARVAEDAQELNRRVVRALRNAGLTVFVPQEEDRVNPEHKTAPFAKDFVMMCKAKVAVVVGRLGIDCAIEVGWFAGMGVSMVRVAAEDDELSPMLAGVLAHARAFRHDELNIAADEVVDLVRAEEHMW